MTHASNLKYGHSSSELSAGSVPALLAVCTALYHEKQCACIGTSHNLEEEL
jgi:hypothetical protein